MSEDCTSDMSSIGEYGVASDGYPGPGAQRSGNGERGIMPRRQGRRPSVGGGLSFRHAALPDRAEDELLRLRYLTLKDKVSKQERENEGRKLARARRKRLHDNREGTSSQWLGRAEVPHGMRERVNADVLFTTVLNDVRDNKTVWSPVAEQPEMKERVDGLFSQYLQNCDELWS